MSFLGGLAGGAIGGAVVNLYLDDKQFKAGLAGAEAQTKTATTTTGKFGAAGAAAFAVIGTAALKFGADSVRAFAESEQVMAQTEAVIKSTGSAAGFTATQVHDMAAALQDQTTFSDEAIQSAENLLLTFTRIGHEALPQATRAALDVATAFHTDLNSAAKMVGKALNDPLAGLTALSRAGVQFSAQQKEVIKRLVETGRLAEAQDMILGELAKQTGGSASAAADTYQGKLAQMANEFNDLQEIVGKFLVTAIAPLIEDFGELAKAMDAVASSGGGGSAGILGESIRFLTSDFNPLVAMVHYSTWAFQQLDSIMGGIETTLTPAEGAVEDIKKEMARMGIETTETGKQVVAFAGMTGEALKDYRESTRQNFSVAGDAVIGFKAKVEGTARSFQRGLDNMRKQAQETFRDLREFNELDLGEGVKKFLLEQGPAAIDAFMDSNRKGREHIVEDIAAINEAHKRQGVEIDRATGKTNDLNSAMDRLDRKKATAEVRIKYMLDEDSLDPLSLPGFSDNG